MEMGRQIHAPAALLLEEEPRYPLVSRLRGWVGSREVLDFVIGFLMHL